MTTPDCRRHTGLRCILISPAKTAPLIKDHNTPKGRKISVAALENAISTEDSKYEEILEDTQEME